jgi:hypothetical protein
MLQYQLLASMRCIQRTSWTVIGRQNPDSTKRNTTGSFSNRVETARSIYSLTSVCSKEAAESRDEFCGQPFPCINVDVVQGRSEERRGDCCEGAGGTIFLQFSIFAFVRLTKKGIVMQFGVCAVQWEAMSFRKSMHPPL